MTIAIIDYGMGNLRSVQKAFLALNQEAVITNDLSTIRNADKIVLPGVGAFKDAIQELRQLGLDMLLEQEIKKGKPFLGICLGMQLLFEKSYENGAFEGLGLLKGEIVKFAWDAPSYLKAEQQGQSLKIPHMGWNTLEITKKDPIFSTIESESSVYFVHSYHVQTDDAIISAYTEYGKKIPVAVQKDNIFALQFHPEKSGDVGLQMLKSFGRIN